MATTITTRSPSGGTITTTAPNQLATPKSPFTSQPISSPKSSSSLPSWADPKSPFKPSPVTPLPGGVYQTPEGGISVAPGVTPPKGSTYVGPPGTIIPSTGGGGHHTGGGGTTTPGTYSPETGVYTSPSGEKQSMPVAHRSLLVHSCVTF